MLSSIKKISLVTLLICITVSCKKSTSKQSQLQVESQSLKKTFQNNFFIGLAINEVQIDEQDPMANALLKKEFNSITTENNLKWMYTVSYTHLRAHET